MKRLAWAVLLAGVGVASADPPKPVAIYPLHGSYVSNPVMSAADGKKLEDRIALLERRLADLEAAAGKAQPPEEPAKPDFLPDARAFCLSCHSPASAEKKGGEFVMFADNQGAAFARFTDYQQAKIRQKVSDGTMPPPDPDVKLPPADRRARLAKFALK